MGGHIVGEDLVLNLYHPTSLRHYTATCLTYVQTYVLLSADLSRILSESDLMLTKKKIRHMALKLRFSRNLVMVAQSKSLSRSVKAASARKKMKTTLNVTSSVSKWRLKVQSTKAAQIDNALEDKDQNSDVVESTGSLDDGVLVNLSQVPQMSTEQ